MKSSPMVTDHNRKLSSFHFLQLYNVFIVCDDFILLEETLSELVPYQFSLLCVLLRITSLQLKVACDMSTYTSVYSVGRYIAIVQTMTCCWYGFNKSFPVSSFIHPSIDLSIISDISHLGSSLLQSQHARVLNCYTSKHPSYFRPAK